MRRINWLASYPKSGNTWFRVFLINLLRDKDEPADINELPEITVASSRRLFDDNVGIESSDLTHDEVDRLRPDLYRQLSDDAADPFFLKIHDAYSLVEDGVPLVPVDATRRVLYFIRNPLDIAVSFAHHSGVDIEEAIRRINDESFCFCDEPDRLGIQLRQRLSSWSGHVRGWTEAPDLELYVMRYEDMSACPADTFAEALRFVGIEASSARLEKALRFSDFNELRRQEQGSGFAEKPASCPSFFHRGGAGAWKQALDNRQAQRIIDTHGSAMERFGYLDNQGRPL
jgi:hypothetical protein